MLKRSKRIIKIILAISVISLVMLIGYKGINAIKGRTGITQPIVISQVRNAVSDKNILHKETVVSKFNSMQKIQVIQTSVSQSVTINNGYTNNFFKNDKVIGFTGLGSYNLDLSKIGENNITIDNNNKTIKLFISKPTVEIELLENKTTFQDDKGYFAFNDMKMTPEEYETMKYQVKSQMTEKLNGSEYDSIVKIKTKESLENILNKLTDNNYTVTIIFGN